MGIFRYIVQGFGWEIGSQAAREGIDALKERDNAPKPSPTELAKLEREREKQAARDHKEREAALAKREADVEAQLRALKKQAKKP